MESERAQNKPKTQQPKLPSLADTWTLLFLADDIWEYLMLDLEQGATLSAKAESEGIAVYPINLSGFLEACPWLQVSPQVSCFHVEHGTIVGSNETNYSGPIMFMVGPQLQGEDDAQRLLNAFDLRGSVISLPDAIEHIRRTAN